MVNMRDHYDLLVLGSGPGGQKAAIAAAKLGKHAAVVDGGSMMGGVCVNTGTIPSKTLREAVVHLTGMSVRDVYGANFRVKQDITMADLLARTTHVMRREAEVVRDQLSRNRVDLHDGMARFTGPHSVVVEAPGTPARHLTADKFVVAVGTRPARPADVDFGHGRVVDSDGVLQLEEVPQTMVVVGAGVIGIEYASMFAALGTKVTVVESRPQFLDFCDSEIVEALKFHLRDLRVAFRLGESVVKVQADDQGTLTTLASGKRITADTVLYSAGRQGATDSLDLAAAGLEADKRGRLVVDKQFRTEVEHIYAVGDVIGFPALASTSMEQGRLAAYHAFGEQVNSLIELQPIGIYSVPEISYCGHTEDELTRAAIPYEVGVARYRELARGAIVGDSHGKLKLLVSTEDRKLLGVHVVGATATELVHVGQAVMTCGGTVDHLVDTVFNYPTLSEAYKVAALDATNKMRAASRFD
ncbi:Si-specific NAD(P)(+) transhydrogenase [Kineococcus sp. SYSU DK003]|uniref:Si-specific NAD(P)(+) transhydrogenase n=1 Tax=Kineococcus sp. SYSU DK003 TaxID=3383124 RepID=UPI003D7E0908